MTDQPRDEHGRFRSRHYIEITERLRYWSQRMSYAAKLAVPLYVMPTEFRELRNLYGGDATFVPTAKAGQGLIAGALDVIIDVDRAFDQECAMLGELTS